MDKPVIASPQVTQHILNRFKLRADKKLGQNFLIDEKVVRQIVEAAELSEADTVLEVGPGIGTLTQGLAESKAQVVAVELDTRLLPVLATTLEGYDNVRVVHGDILKVNIMEEVGAANFKVCANLPYYITTPIIFALLEKRLPMERLVAMVQKEVAERMAAQPGGKDQFEIGFAFRALTLKSCNQLFYGFLIGYGAFFLFSFGLIAPPCGIVGQIALVHSRRQDAAQRVV